MLYEPNYLPIPGLIKIKKYTRAELDSVGLDRGPKTLVIGQPSNSCYSPFNKRYSPDKIGGAPAAAYLLATARGGDENFPLKTTTITATKKHILSVPTNGKCYDSGEDSNVGAMDV